MMRFLRSAFVIARRDFSATVLSKAFIFFLLGPLFPLLLGGVFGSIGARVATQAERPVVAVVSSESDFARLSAARDAAGRGARPTTRWSRSSITRRRRTSRRSSSGCSRAAIPPVRAVLTGGLARPAPDRRGRRRCGTFGSCACIVANARAPAEVGAGAAAW